MTCRVYSENVWLDSPIHTSQVPQLPSKWVGEPDYTYMRQCGVEEIEALVV